MNLVIVHSRAAVSASVKQKLRELVNSSISDSSRMNAMERIATLIGVTPRVMRELYYAERKIVPADIYLRIEAAYCAHLEHGRARAEALSAKYKTLSEGLERGCPDG